MGAEEGTWEEPGAVVQERGWSHIEKWEKPRTTQLGRRMLSEGRDEAWKAVDASVLVSGWGAYVVRRCVFQVPNAVFLTPDKFLTLLVVLCPPSPRLTPTVGDS